MFQLIQDDFYQVIQRLRSGKKATVKSKHYPAEIEAREGGGGRGGGWGGMTGEDKARRGWDLTWRDGTGFLQLVQLGGKSGDASSGSELQEPS